MMIDKRDSLAPWKEENTDVRTGQIRMLFAATPITLASILFVSTLLVAILWQTIDPAILLTWYGLTNGLSGYRLHLYRKLGAIPAGVLLGDFWQRRANLASLMSGATWGAASWFLFAEHHIGYQAITAAVVAGVCASAITSLSALLPAVRLFLLAALVPLILRFGLSTSELHLELTAMVALFTVVLLASAKRLHRTILDSLNMRYRYQMTESTIQHLALYDELTDLPNRRLFLSMLDREMASAERSGRHGAVFFLDLDRFKSVNDTLGHAIGDLLLIESARRLVQHLRKEDTTARLGGDEFVVLLPEVGADSKSAGVNSSRLAEKVRELFTRPFRIQGQEIHLSISIGIALFPSHTTPEDLIKHADVAMYRVKNEGRNGTRLFSQEMQEAVNQQRETETELRRALRGEEFELYYQPQYDTDGQVIGAETLLRWNHPERGLLAPGSFIQVAEQSGLIVPIGDWVLQSACEHLTLLEPGLTLSVNVSPRQFGDAGFVKRLKQVLRATAANPQRLKLEVTENLALANIEHTIDTMQQLRKLGVSFSVDDFGTGYSSLSYLHRLPIDELKIDQSFVRNISNDSEHAVIIDAIIAMAQQLKLRIVAEGIESAEELAYLKARRCEFFQGYFFSRPLPWRAFESLRRG